MIMIESPKNMVARSQHTNSGSQLSKVVSKISDIFKIQQYNNLSKTTSLSKLANIQRRVEDDYTSNVINDGHYTEIDLIALQIAERIESTLREARSKLGNCKILLPQNLALQISLDIINMSEHEPCGLRGCLLYVNYDDRNISHQLGQVKFGDRTIVPTFVMFLHLKRNSSSWLQIVTSRILSRFGQETVVINDCYKLSKKKLFRELGNPQ